MNNNTNIEFKLFGLKKAAGTAQWALRNGYFYTIMLDLSDGQILVDVNQDFTPLLVYKTKTIYIVPVLNGKPTMANIKKWIKCFLENLEEYQDETII